MEVPIGYTLLSYRKFFIFLEFNRCLKFNIKIYTGYGEEDTKWSFLFIITIPLGVTLTEVLEVMIYNRVI